jgi:hypothetical protein
MSNLAFEGLVEELKQSFKFVVGATSSLMPILQIDALDALIQTTDEVRVKSIIEQLWQAKS